MNDKLSQIDRLSDIVKNTSESIKKEKEKLRQKHIAEQIELENKLKTQNDYVSKLEKEINSLISNELFEGKNTQKIELIHCEITKRKSKDKVEFDKNKENDIIKFLEEYDIIEPIQIKKSLSKTKLMNIIKNDSTIYELLNSKVSLIKGDYQITYKIK